MDLPRKDKYGNNYLSYSQLSTFKRSKEDYYNQYILNVEFKGNEYTDFGTKIGNSIENNNFSYFNESEINILKQVRRLDLFEYKTILNYKDFYVIGFIDSCSSDLLEIIDYKTGGKGKHLNYSKEDYNQLQIYALSLRQKTGVTPLKASVNFITRGGNLYKGIDFYVDNVKPKIIDIDIGYEKLKKTYWNVLNTAKQINEFYKLNK